jgi:sugar phosphate isomerase/epimerase
MIVNRRHVLAGAGGIAALGVTGIAQAAQIKAVGIQLYTVRDLFQKDPVKTLGDIARIGYKEVEYGGGGYDAMDHKLLRRTTDRLGLRAPSIHVPYEALLGAFDKQVEMAKTLGADTIVLPYMVDKYRTEAGWTEALPNINRFATDLRKAGLGFAYHNHDFEFTVKPGGVSLYERLLKATDPGLVKVELDLYWVGHAGEDVGAWIDRLGPRLYAYHVKDARADGSMTAVGAGKTDFAALFRRRGSAGVRHFYVENDEAPAPYLPDITTSFRTLRALRY